MYYLNKTKIQLLYSIYIVVKCSILINDFTCIFKHIRSFGNFGFFWLNRRSIKHLTIIIKIVSTYRNFLSHIECTIICANCNKTSSSNIIVIFTNLN